VFSSRPLASPGKWHRTAPILLLLAALWGGSALTDRDRPWVLAAAGVLLAAVTIAVWKAPWSQLPAWTELSFPVFAVAFPLLLRYGAGGEANVLLLAMFAGFVWIALYGSLVHLAVAFAAVVFLAVGPLLLTEASEGEVENLIIAALIMGVLAVMVFTLVSELRQQTRSLEDLVRISSDATIATNPATKIIAWNEAAEHMFGWSTTEAVGRDILTTLVPPEQYDSPNSAYGLLTSTHPGEDVRGRRTGAMHRQGYRLDVELSLHAAARPLTRLERLLRVDSPVVFLIARDISDEIALSRARELELAVSSALVQSSSLREALPDLAASLANHVQADTSLWWEPTEDGLYLSDIWHQPGLEARNLEPLLQSGTRLKPGEGAPGAVTDSHPVAVVDLAEVRDPRRESALQAEGMTSSVVMRFADDGATVGVLELLRRVERDITDADVSGLTDIVHRVSQFLTRVKAVQRVSVLERTVTETVDIVKGAPARDVFAGWILRECRRADRDGSSLSLILLRADSEHPFTADQVGRWWHMLRITDLLSWFDDQTIAVILPGCSASMLGLLHDRFRDVSPSPVRVGGGQLRNGEDCDAFVSRVVDSISA
jgi:PAS domain S-box-containing protein